MNSNNNNIRTKKLDSEYFTEAKAKQLFLISVMFDERWDHSDE